MRAIVVGGGAYGTSVAVRLAEVGAAVVLLERDEPGHARAASGGVTRVLRFEYGAESRYTELTIRAVERWRGLERDTGDVLFVPAGVIHLARGDGVWERVSRDVVAAAGIAVELLETGEIVERWPAFSAAGIAFGLYSPSGGFLWARRATRALAGAADRAGVQVRSGAEVIEVEDGRVALADGSTLTADVVVVCTGAWSPAVDGRLGAIVPRRQVTAYFDADPGSLPIFNDGNCYGVPAHDGLGLKCAFHRTDDGEIGDPADARLRVVRDDDVEALRDFLAMRLPGVAGACVREADVCFYAMTADEHPIVDRLDDRTVCCAGLSGHGFKFAPVLGAAAAELALGLEPSVDLRGFEIDRPALRTV